MSNDPANARARWPVTRNPTKLTQERTAKICQALRLGAFLETAAASAGVHRDTLLRWMVAGARKDALKEMKDFVAQVDIALADAEMNALERITNATEWQASAWRLERRYPERWGRVERLKAEHTGKDGTPLAPPTVYVVAPGTTLPRNISGDPTKAH